LPVDPAKGFSFLTIQMQTLDIAATKVVGKKMNNIGLPSGTVSPQPIRQKKHVASIKQETQNIAIVALPSEHERHHPTYSSFSPDLASLTPK